MAKQEVVVYTVSCDVCGKDADGSHTVTHGNGARPTVYEIDLCAVDAKKLAKTQDALTALLGHGRRSGGSRQRGASGSRPRAKRSSSVSDPAAVRAWAKASGYDVSDRGRISAGIRDAYAEAK